MKRLDLSRYAPVGYPTRGHLWAAALMALSEGIDGLVFLTQWSNAKWRLDVGGYLAQGAIMKDFAVLIRPLLAACPLLAVIYFVLFTAMHYAYHYGATKSVYTMRRLPDRFELHRRCLTLPLAFALGILAFGFLLLLINYWVYMRFTPAECIAPGQWTKIWRFGRA